MSICASCETPLPAACQGWMHAGSVVLCPGCVPLLTQEDVDELGAALRSVLQEGS